MKVLVSSLNVILDSIDRIEEYIIWLDFDKFIEDNKTFDAVLMQLQHIWETTKSTVEKFWDIEWLPIKEMIGLRNFISHDYLWISKRIIWETVVSDLPEIRIKLLEEISKNSL
jgi:uncharacterized protein with HEPN domain